MLGSEIGSMEFIGSECSSVGSATASGATGGSVEFCPVVCSTGASFCSVVGSCVAGCGGVCSSCGGVTKGAAGVVSGALVTGLGSEASVVVAHRVVKGVTYQARGTCVK